MLCMYTRHGTRATRQQEDNDLSASSTTTTAAAATVAELRVKLLERERAASVEFSLYFSFIGRYYTIWYFGCSVRE